jgi:3-oxoacyl-(acyl-carrier-protein) synthase
MSGARLADHEAQLGLVELATATVPAGTVPPSLPGFVVSSFSPLVAAAAERCLADRHGSPPAAAEIGRRTAVVVVSGSGDAHMAAHVAQAVDEGARIGPLLFFQAVPNSVAGHIAARWGLHGPVVCLCPTGDPKADGLAQARLLIDDGDADEVLVVLVEQAGATHAALVGNELASQAQLIEGEPR